jgi:hypothetical protein
VRGQPTALKTDPRRNLLVYAVDRTVVLREIMPTGGRPIHCQAKIPAAHRLRHGS